MDATLRTDTSPELRFALTALSASLALFGLVRLEWTERHVIDLMLVFQERLALWYSRASMPAIAVTSSCSGADLMAVAVATTLSYPVPWKSRLIGATGALLLVVTLNVARIATLMLAAGSPSLLDLLHQWVWPIVLSLALLAYVGAWIVLTRRQVGHRAHSIVRALGTVAGFAIVYAVLTPWAMTGHTLDRACEWTAAAAGSLLTLLRAPATAGQAQLATARGAFVVTPECLFSPVLPLYAAFLTVATMPRRQRLLGVVLALPFLFALGVARVLILAVPPLIIHSPLVLVHGFHQLVLGAAILAGAIWFNRGNGAVARRLGVYQAMFVTVAIAAGILVFSQDAVNAALVAAASLARLVLPHAQAAVTTSGDVQGATVLMPAYQLSMLIGLWIACAPGARMKRLAAALVLLACTQIAWLVGVGELHAHLGLAVHASLVRAWAVGVPVAVALLLFLRVEGTRVDEPAYRHFWNEVGEGFPSLTGAESTRVYFEDEVRVLRESLPPLRDLRLLKTDLWDEAKNTRILQWAAGEGALVFGVDIAAPIARQAVDAFAGETLSASVADVRCLPFGDNSFDAIYSMGTVEHFHETEAAVVELCRVLKPGGRLILGVPNKFDPFGRPLLVAALHAIGCYAYGFEKAYSRRQLHLMLERAGCDVTSESGILFMPGWLRILDLYWHTRWRPGTALTGPAVRAFAALARRYPRLHRHGYLLVSVGQKVQAHALTDRSTGIDRRPHSNHREAT